MTCVFLQSALNKFRAETAVCVTADRAGADFPVYSAARAAVRELGHFAVNAAQGAVHAEQHHNKFIAEPCSNISDDKQQDRPEKVEKQQNNAVNSQRSDRHAVQDFQQTLGVCVPEIEKIMQLGCRAVVVIRLADKQRVQRDAARKNQ